jgi:mannose-6-phosphate isomerase-like protein (cupin superfamily)
LTENGTRRVVTGTSAEGKSVVASDTLVEPMTLVMMPGAEFLYFWGDDKRPVYPDAGTEPPYRSWFPAADGFRFEQITIPPDSTPKPADLDTAAALAEAREKLPGLIDVMEPDHPGMHRTDSIDFVYVLSGRCIMVLDDDTRLDLNTGDTVIQNGTRHGWRVPYDQPCRLLCISVGATRRE